MFYRKCGNDWGKINLNFLYKCIYICRYLKNCRNYYIFCKELGNDFE